MSKDYCLAFHADYETRSYCINVFYIDPDTGEGHCVDDEPDTYFTHANLQGDITEEEFHALVRSHIEKQKNKLN
jgi:hypothetical protein